MRRNFLLPSSLASVFCYVWLATNPVVSVPTAAVKFFANISELPETISGSARLAAVYDGQDTIYVLGGFRAKAWSYTISTGAVADIGPFVGLSGGSAVMTKSGEILYFGGDTSAYDKPSYAIHSYTPGSRNSGSVVGNLTRRMKSTTFAWDSSAEVAYFFGSEPYLDPYSILKYEHATKQVSQLSNLPHRGIYDAAAVWDSTTNEAYIFGGAGGISDRSLVHKFTPAGMGTLVELPDPLPQITNSPCAVLVGTDQIYVPGEYNLMKFDIKSKQSEIVAVDRYPNDLYYASCVYVPKLGRIYLFGAFVYYAETVYRGESISYIDLGTVPSTSTPAPTNQTPTPGPTSTPAPTTCPAPTPPQDCSDGTTKKIPDPSSCDTFFYCNAGLKKKYPCPVNQQFNPAIAECDAATVVKCGAMYNK